MFTATFTISCLHQIEDTLSTPSTGYCVINHESARLCYIKEGELKYIYFPTQYDFVIFLEKQSVIDGFTMQNDSIEMYKNVLFTVQGLKGEPVQHLRRVPVKWEELSFSPMQVITFAAQYEWEQTGRIMGKVVSMAKRVFQQAA